MQGQTPTPLPPSTERLRCWAGFRPRDSCLQTLSCKKKKKCGAIPLALTRGQQRLEGKNMGGPGQPLTVKYKKKYSPTQRPPRANKHKPQAPVTSFERLSFVRLSRSDDDPPSSALISELSIPSFLKEPAPSPSLG